MTRADIEAEMAKLKKRAQKRQEQAREDQRRHEFLEDKLRRLDLEPLVGVAGGVMLRFKGQSARIPTDATGTLTKIGRTRADVDFGSHGVWSFPIYDLIATTKQDERGFTLTWGLANANDKKAVSP